MPPATMHRAPVAACSPARTAPTSRASPPATSGVCPEAEIAAVLIDVPHADDAGRAPARDLQRHQPHHARGRVSARDRAKRQKADRHQHQPRHERRRPRRIERRLALARCLSRQRPAGPSASPPAMRARRRRETEDDIGWIMGRIHTSGRIPVARARASSWNGRSSATASRTCRRTSSRSGTARRTVSSSRSSRRAARTGSTVKPREYVENVRLPSGTTVSIYNELYHPTNGANYIAIYLSPNSSPRQLSRHPGRHLEGPAATATRSATAASTPGSSATIPARSAASRGRRLFRFPSFFTQKLERRLALDQLAGVRPSRDRRRQSRRCPPADQRVEQPGADARRSLASPRSPRRAPTSSPRTGSRA